MGSVYRRLLVLHVLALVSDVFILKSLCSQRHERLFSLTPSQKYRCRRRSPFFGLRQPKLLKKRTRVLRILEVYRTRGGQSDDDARQSSSFDWQSKDNESNFGTSEESPSGRDILDETKLLARDGRADNEKLESKTVESKKGNSTSKIDHNVGPESFCDNGMNVSVHAGTGTFEKGGTGLKWAKGMFNVAEEIESNGKSICEIAGAEDIRRTVDKTQNADSNHDLEGTRSIDIVDNNPVEMPMSTAKKKTFAGAQVNESADERAQQHVSSLQSKSSTGVLEIESSHKAGKGVKKRSAVHKNIQDNALTLDKDDLWSTLDQEREGAEQTSSMPAHLVENEYSFVDRMGSDNAYDGKARATSLGSKQGNEDGDRVDLWLEGGRNGGDLTEELEEEEEENIIIEKIIIKQVRKDVVSSLRKDHEPQTPASMEGWRNMMHVAVNRCKRLVAPLVIVAFSQVLIQGWTVDDHRRKSYEESFLQLFKFCSEVIKNALFKKQANGKDGFVMHTKGARDDNCNSADDGFDERLAPGSVGESISTKDQHKPSTGINRDPYSTEKSDDLEGSNELVGVDGPKELVKADELDGTDKIDYKFQIDDAKDDTQEAHMFDDAQEACLVDDTQEAFMVDETDHSDEHEDIIDRGLIPRESNSHSLDLERTWIEKIIAFFFEKISHYFRVGESM